MTSIKLLRPGTKAPSLYRGMLANRYDFFDRGQGARSCVFVRCVPTTERFETGPAARRVARPAAKSGAPTASFFHLQLKSVLSHLTEMMLGPVVSLSRGCST